ncbi:MAG: hypothetical protein IJY21_01125 [Clostridia bacterium]|nr:hypothetical protein [Clostridia bacterium]
MANFKKKFKFYAGYVWQLIKDSLPSGIMYICAGSILMMLTIKVKESEIVFKNSVVVWSVVCIVAAAAYNGLIMWANGGQQYEMLAAGNVRRKSEQLYGEGYKISKHKEVKEYRLWKGFVVGGIIALFTVIVGIVWGVKQAQIDARLAQGKIGITELLGIMLSGWSVVPVYYANFTGSDISYFVTIVFALLPIVVTAAFYIGGAYARRNKNLRRQMIADKAAADAANKAKKINYGGLPGTKPKKKK